MLEQVQPAEHRGEGDRLEHGQIDRAEQHQRDAGHQHTDRAERRPAHEGGELRCHPRGDRGQQHEADQHPVRRAFVRELVRRDRDHPDERHRPAGDGQQQREESDRAGVGKSAALDSAAQSQRERHPCTRGTEPGQDDPAVEHHAGRITEHAEPAEVEMPPHRITRAGDRGQNGKDEDAGDGARSGCGHAGRRAGSSSRTMHFPAPTCREPQISRVRRMGMVPLSPKWGTFRMPAGRRHPAGTAPTPRPHREPAPGRRETMDG